MNKKIKIGIDVGVASCGWAILDESNHIIKHGVRLFDRAEEPKSGESLAAGRRNKRRLRRTISRIKTRKRDLIKLFYQNKLFVPNDSKLRGLDFGKNVNILIAAFREEVLAFNKGENFDVYQWRQNLVHQSITNVGNISLDQTKKFFLRSIYWYCHNRGFSHEIDLGSSIDDQKTLMKNGFWKNIELMLEKQLLIDQNDPKQTSEIDSLDKQLKLNEEFSNLKIHYPVDAQILMKNNALYPQDALNKKSEVLSHLTKIKGTINNNFKREWYGNELKQLLIKNADFLKQNGVNYEEFQNTVLSIFERQRNSAEGPGGENSPTIYGLYQKVKNEESGSYEIKKLYKTLPEKVTSKCTFYTEETVAPKFSFSQYLFKLFEYLNNLSYGSPQEDNDESHKLTVESKINLLRYVFEDDNNQHYFEGKLKEIENEKHLLKIFRQQFNNPQMELKEIVGLQTETESKTKSKKATTTADETTPKKVSKKSSIKPFPAKLDKLKNLFQLFYDSGFKFKNPLIFNEEFINKNFEFIRLMDLLTIFLRNNFSPKAIQSNFFSQDPVLLTKNPKDEQISLLEAIKRVFVADDFNKAANKFLQGLQELEWSQGTAQLSLRFLWEFNLIALKTTLNLSQWRHEIYGKNINDSKWAKYGLNENSKHLSATWLEDQPYSPTFKRGAKQAISVLNAIFDFCEKNQYTIDVIAVELPRDLNTKQERQNHIKSVKFWTDVRKEFVDGDRIIGNKKHLSKTDLRKYILWKEQQHKDPYDGKTIQWENIKDYQIDHIIPLSYFLDNSNNNVVLTHRDNNVAKANRTPKEWLGIEQFENMTQFWQELYIDGKYTIDSNRQFKNRKKFDNLTFDINKDKNSIEFLNKNLSDTRGIAYNIKEILEAFKRFKYQNNEDDGYRVFITYGKVVSFLRNHRFVHHGEEKSVNEIIDPYYQLPSSAIDEVEGDGILNAEVVAKKQEEIIKKNREWNGTHAQDAVLIAAINSMPQVNHFIKHQKYLEETKSNLKEGNLKRNFNRTQEWLNEDFRSLVNELENKQKEIQYSRKINFMSNLPFHDETLYRGLRNKQRPNEFYEVVKIPLDKDNYGWNELFLPATKPQSLLMDKNIWSEIRKMYIANLPEGEKDQLLSTNKKTWPKNKISPFKEIINQQKANVQNKYDNYSPLESNALVVNGKKVKFVRIKQNQKNPNHVLFAKNNVSERSVAFFQSMNWAWVDLYAIDIKGKTEFLPVPANALTVKLLPKGVKRKFNIEEYLNSQEFSDEKQINLAKEIYQNMPNEIAAPANYDYKDGYLNYALDKLSGKMKKTINNVRFVTRLNRGNVFVNSADPKNSFHLYVAGFIMFDDKFDCRKTLGNLKLPNELPLKMTIASLLSKHYTKIVHMDVLGNIHKTIDLTKFITKHND